MKKAIVPILFCAAFGACSTTVNTSAGGTGAAGPTASAAGSFNAPLGMRARPVNNAVFEVWGSANPPGGDYWCAAADFARRALGASWTTKVYVARGRGQGVTVNKRSTVHFTVNPSAAGVAPAAPSISLSSFRVGDNMSVQAANQYCIRAPIRW